MMLVLDALLAVFAAVVCSMGINLWLRLRRRERALPTGAAAASSPPASPFCDCAECVAARPLVLGLMDFSRLQAGVINVRRGRAVCAVVHCEFVTPDLVGKTMVLAMTDVMWERLRPTVEECAKELK